MADYGTLDEPVTETIMRDLRMVGNKMMCVLNPRKANIQTLKDWDLWGPLILCLMLATLLSWFAPYEQASLVFASVFVIIWCGAAVVTVNALLLGGNISFFQSVCVLGYCIFPLNIASVICILGGHIVWRVCVVAVCFFWSTGASLGACNPLASCRPSLSRQAPRAGFKLTPRLTSRLRRFHGRARTAQPKGSRRVSAVPVLYCHRMAHPGRCPARQPKVSTTRTCSARIRASSPVLWRTLLQRARFRSVRRASHCGERGSTDGGSHR